MDLITHATARSKVSLGFYLSAWVSLRSCAPRMTLEITNVIAKRTTTVAKITNAIAEITNDFAEITNAVVEITNDFAKTTNAIAEIATTITQSTTVTVCVAERAAIAMPMSESYRRKREVSIVRY